MKSVWLLLVLSATAIGQLKLPSVISDNMVIQSDRPIAIWGWASPGNTVFISGSCIQSSVTAIADKDGKWISKVYSQKPGGPYNLTIQDSKDTEIILNNILCGEVWLCSGQSNMAMKLESTDSYQRDMATANYPNIRMFAVPRASSLDKQTDIAAKNQKFEKSYGEWQECYPENIADLSAVAYYFGRELHNELNVPIGLIISANGGTTIEAWTPNEGYEGVDWLDEITALLKIKKPGSPEYNANLERALEDVRKWKEKALIAIEKGTSAPELSISLNLPEGRQGIEGLYNAMIYPIVPYTIKGVLWYQGESNLLNGMLYYKKKEALIAGWRKVWGQEEFPVYFVQLPPFRYGAQDALPLMREAQLYSLNIPNTGMVVTTDVGDYEDIHPGNKKDVGKRLALWALAKDYSRELVYSGPLFREVTFENGRAIVRFNHTGSGLTTRDGKSPDWFELAGDNGVFKKAEAIIYGDDAVLVAADEVKHPQVVRLGWAEEAVPNLMNAEGLPASPFSSDISIRLLPESENVALNRPYVCSHPNTQGSWNEGLTNGNWAEDSLNCFATGEIQEFPGYVTIDLGKAKKIGKVYTGVPSYGSTRTIQIEISLDGKDFKPVGKHVFSQGTAERKMISFVPEQAKYVRLAYPDNHRPRAQYSSGFVMYTTEVEVYEY